ncbi:MAG: HEAT repeat domain-containing protein, partial [Deltaproteobacteria bacterium]
MIENRKHWISAPAGNPTMVLVVMLLLFTFTGCGSPRWYESYGFKSHEEMKRASVVPVLITALGDGNPDARTGAAFILGDIGPEAKAAVPALIRALDDSDEEVRSYAAQSLGLIGHGTQEVISALIKALSDPEDYVGDRAAYALELLGPQVRPQAREAVLALIRAQLDYSDRFSHDSRHKAIKRFGLEPKELVSILVEALSEREGAVRARAANELARLGPEAREAVPALIKTLDDHDADVRRQACSALGQIGPEAREAVPALIKALGDNYPRARKSAVKSIGKIGAAPELVGPALTVALRDPDPGIRNETLLALEKIGYTGHDFLQSLEKIADKDPNNTIRKLASDMLRKMRFTALASGKPVEPKQAPTAAPPVSQAQRPAPPPIGLGQRWAVVIGISQYHDTRIPSLRYASVDAESFYEWLISLNGGKYAPSRVNLLIDRDATARNIRQALFEWLEQALEEDIVT